MTFLLYFQPADKQQIFLVEPSDFSFASKTERIIDILAV